MKQQIRNDRLNNESSDHDTFQRFAHFLLAFPFFRLRAIALAQGLHSLCPFTSTFDGNAEGLGNFAARGSNTMQLVAAHS